MRLVGIEMSRALARRSIRLLIAVALVGITVTGVAVFVTSEDQPPPSAAQVRQAEASRAAQVQKCREVTAQSADPPNCEQVVPPAATGDKRFQLVDVWHSNGTGDSVFLATAFFLLVGAIIGGASFVGAEWRTKTVATVLTWEPRRVRLLSARLLAAAVVAFVVAVVLHGLVVAALLPTALVKGTTAGADATWLRGAVGAALRISAVAAGAAVVSGGLASIGRNTAAGIGLCFGYALVAERLLAQVRPGWQPWLLLQNAVILLTGRRLSDPNVTHGVGVAVMVLGVYLVAVVGASVLDFARRDVT